MDVQVWGLDAELVVEPASSNQLEHAGLSLCGAHTNTQTCESQTWSDASSTPSSCKGTQYTLQQHV